MATRTTLNDQQSATILNAVERARADGATRKDLSHLVARLLQGYRVYPSVQKVLHFTQRGSLGDIGKDLAEFREQLEDASALAGDLSEAFPPELTRVVGQCFKSIFSHVSEHVEASIAQERADLEKARARASEDMSRARAIADAAERTVEHVEAEIGRLRAMLEDSAATASTLSKTIFELQSTLAYMRDELTRAEARAAAQRQVWAATLSAAASAMPTITRVNALYASAVVVQAAPDGGETIFLAAGEERISAAFPDVVRLAAFCGEHLAEYEAMASKPESRKAWSWENPRGTARKR